MDTPSEEPEIPDPQQPPPTDADTSGTAQQHLIELQRTNRALRFLSSVNQALMHVATEQKLMQAICEIAIEIGKYRMAWVGFSEHDLAHHVRPICHAGHEDGYLKQVRISWAEDEFGQGPTGTAIRTDRPVIQSDIMHAENFGPWREAALARGYRSSIALPLHIDNQVIGALTLYGDAPYIFSEEEQELLVELAGDLSFGLSALRTRIRQQKAEKALRESNRRLHAIIEAAPFGAYEYELHADGRLVFIGYNPAADRILGVDHARFIGLSIEEAFPPPCHDAHSGCLSPCGAHGRAI